MPFRALTPRPLSEYENRGCWPKAPEGVAAEKSYWTPWNQIYSIEYGEGCFIQNLIQEYVIIKE